MPDRVLVAYATKYGSTKEVAEAIATALGEAGVFAELEPAADVKDLGGYSAVVLGTPLYVGKMRKDASEFLERNRAALAAMPVALFALGPVSATDDMAEAAKQLDVVLEKFPWLELRAKTMFVGKYDPDHLRGLDKLIPKIKATPLYGIPLTDDRDWAAISAWAAALPEVLA
ncbi:MAG: flavodoxin [Actinobacteria bacterium]|nr:flavodoxin [Actinomycetota bacterium]